MVGVNCVNQKYTLSFKLTCTLIYMYLLFLFVFCFIFSRAPQLCQLLAVVSFAVASVLMLACDDPKFELIQIISNLALIWAYEIILLGGLIDFLFDQIRITYYCLQNLSTYLPPKASFFNNRKISYFFRIGFI